MKGDYRGFASLPREHARACAKKAGTLAHARGRAHVFTPDEARAAGAIGGAASIQSKRERELERRAWDDAARAADEERRRDLAARTQRTWDDDHAP